MSPDVSIIGIVFSVILFIIFFSAVVLYLVFRMKDSFKTGQREPLFKRKTVFMIVIVLVAVGSCYFFASNLIAVDQPETDVPTADDQPLLSLSLVYPSRVRNNAPFTLSFTITNPTAVTAHDVTIQTNLLQYVTVLSSTHARTDNTIQIGDVASGTTIFTVKLMSPEQSTVITDTVIITYTEMAQPITQSLSITITGGPG